MNDGCPTTQADPSTVYGQVSDLNKRVSLLCERLRKISGTIGVFRGEDSSEQQAVGFDNTVNGLLGDTEKTMTLIDEEIAHLEKRIGQPE